MWEVLLWVIRIERGGLGDVCFGDEGDESDERGMGVVGMCLPTSLAGCQHSRASDKMVMGLLNSQYRLSGYSSR